MYITIKKNRNGKRIYSHYNVYCVSKASGPMTDTATAYCYHVAPIMVYKALNTMYANSGNKRIYTLMCQLVERANVKPMEWENEMENHGIPAEMQTAKTHKYKYTVDDNGEKHRMEVIPYTTFEMTEYGEKLMELTIPANLDCDDLIQTAVEKMVVLSNDGMITDFESVWACARLIFRAVNNYVYAQGKQSATTDSYESIVTTYTHNGVFDENRYTENVLHGQTAKDYIAHVDMKAACAYILSVIRDRLPKRVDGQTAITVFSLVRNGYSNVSIAEKLNIDEKQVRRYAEYINRIVTSPDFRQIVADMMY